LAGTRVRAGVSVPSLRNSSQKSAVLRQSFATQKPLRILGMRPSRGTLDFGDPWLLDSLRPLPESKWPLVTRLLGLGQDRLPQPAGIDRHDHQRRQADLSRLRCPGGVRARPDPRADPGGLAGGPGSRSQRRKAAVAGREEAGPGPVAAPGPGQHDRGHLCHAGDLTGDVLPAPAAAGRATPGRRPRAGTGPNGTRIDETIPLSDRNRPAKCIFKARRPSAMIAPSSLPRRATDGQTILASR
jgi:hypothetical protein